MRIIPRSEWGFDGWRTQPAAVALSRRTEFFVHYEGPATGGRTGVAVPRAIHAYHKRSNGWSGIGYGWVVDQAGTIYEGRGWDLMAAHCPGRNDQWSVQVHIGGAERPSSAALHSVRWLYDEACRRAGRTLIKRGHRDGFSTACPGEPLYAWVKAGMPDPTPLPIDTPSTPSTPSTGGPLMALTDKQQDDLYNRVMGSIPAGSAEDRYNPDGSRARILDSGDGDYLRVTIEAQTAAIKALAATQGADPDKVIAAVENGVADALADLRIVKGQP